MEPDDDISLDPATFVALRDAGQPVVLIDIRFPIERFWKRIPGAVPAPSGFGVPNLPDLPPGTVAVLHCHGGVRTRAAARRLRARGQAVLHLEGGIAAWIAAGFPVDSGTESRSPIPLRAIPGYRDSMAAQSLPTARIAVVGAGINGTMTAWALADRGHAVVLFDRGEPMAETSARSSRMLHGGLRYLAKLRIGMVREALHERSWWRNQKTGLVREFRAHIPIRRGDVRSFLLFGAGVLLYHFLALGSGFQGSRWVSRRTLAARFPDLDTDTLLGAWSYTDALMDDAGLGRWAVATLAKRGVEVRSHTPVAGVSARSVTLADGTVLEFDAVVNAAGPWTERLAATGLGKGESASTGLMLVRGSHLIVRRTLQHAVVLPHVDGRILFFLPWSAETAILGTTEAKQESPDTAEMADSERDELIAAHNAWFRTPLTLGDIVSHYSGLRPLVRSTGGTSAASREAGVELPGGVVTVYGGKWTTARRLGQRVAGVVQQVLAARKGPLETGG